MNFFEWYYRVVWQNLFPPSGGYWRLLNLIPAAIVIWGIVRIVKVWKLRKTIGDSVAGLPRGHWGFMKAKRDLEGPNAKAMNAVIIMQLIVILWLAMAFFIPVIGIFCGWEPPSH